MAKIICEKGSVSFKEAIRDFFKGYVDFKGRSTRAGYWWLVLSVWLVELLLAFGLFAALEFIPTSVSYVPAVFASICVTLLAVVWLATLIPFIALFVRRMRDVGLTTASMIIAVLIYLAADWTQLFHHSALMTFIMILFSLGAFVFTLLPTDCLTTSSQHRALTSFLRQKK